MNMSKKLKQDSKLLVTNYSIFRAVLILIKVKTKIFIKHCIGNVRDSIKKYWKVLSFDKNWKLLIEICFNIFITGIIISYVTTHRNWLSYGLLTIVLMWYLKWFRKLTIARNNEEIDKL